MNAIKHAEEVKREAIRLIEQSRAYEAGAVADWWLHQYIKEAKIAMGRNHAEELAQAIERELGRML